MNEYKQPFISYLSYMFVTPQGTLKWFFFSIHFCSGEGGEGRYYNAAD